MDEVDEMEDGPTRSPNPGIALVMARAAGRLQFIAKAEQCLAGGKTSVGELQVGDVVEHPRRGKA